MREGASTKVFGAITPTDTVYGRAQALTRADETVLWAGSPLDADREARGVLPEATGGAALLAAAATWGALLWSGSLPGLRAADTAPLALTLLACLALAGVLLMAGPAVRRREARATLYVVTDRRVLRCVGNRVEPVGTLPTRAPRR